MPAPDFSKLGETKITVPLILLAALVAFGWKARDFTVEGLDEFFFSEAQGQELAEAVKQNTIVLTDYIRRQEIRDVNDQLEQIGSQITETQLWIAANGENPIATARLGDLVQRRSELQEKKACLLNENITNKEVCDDV